MKAARHWIGTILLLVVAGVGSVSIVSAWRYQEAAGYAYQDADFFKSILADSGSAVVVVDEHGLIQEWSPGAESLFGWNKEESIGYGVAFLIPGGLRAKHRESFDVAMSERVPKVQWIDCTAKTKSKGEIDIRGTIRVARRNGRMIAVAVFNKSDDVKRLDEKK